MELRHLRYFVAAAEELHFRRAAERLGIAQPALSQQIQQLEQEIEALLFHRLTRGVELTDAGKAFLDDARAILEHVEQAKAKAQRVARGDQGMIRIGFTGSASFNPIVPGVIQDYRARFPGIAAGEGVSIVPASMRHMQPQGVAYRAILGDAPRAPLSLAHRSNEPSAAVRNLTALARRAAANIGRDTLPTPS